MVAAVLAVCPGRLFAQTPQSRFLAKADILLYGISLKVDPAEQTVPKNIATIVSTFLQAPNVTGEDLPPFAPDAVVMATLSGPSFPTPQNLTVSPNSPFNIPPLTVPGLHTLDNIRLVSNGEVLLRGTPESVTINVIDKLLVTQVTSRPLTAAEIREAGIVFDKSSFQAYNFTAAFAVQGGATVNLSFPVVLPTLQSIAGANVTNVGLPSQPTLPSIKTLVPDTLTIQTQVPNLSVVGFTLTVPNLQDKTLVVPPIPGVIVIPGNIGFLDQFFSVMLMVSNAAPTGSNLVVSDLTASIVLPPGDDTVVGSADDPLVMANTATGASPSTQPVSQAGPDGVLGTADDVLTLGPGQTGNAEYLVEGKREGSHTVTMNIQGTLNGLPIGPVPITGQAVGAVLVRNPTYSLTFVHPDTVQAGEAYSLDVAVTNTSQSPANFVSINLFPKDIIGATLTGDSSQHIDFIAPGDTATVSFSLTSNVTGKVTAATLASDSNVAGNFELKHTVGELGIPLSPESLVLPKEANALPPALRAAAIGLLGKAWAVATSPAAALPADVPRFSRQIVLDMGVATADAGLRFSLHEPLRDAATGLAMDFFGSLFSRLPQLNPKPDDLQFAQTNYTGFDDLRRRSVRGDAFAQAVADILTPDLASLGVGAFHRDLAEKISDRPAHISVLVGAAGTPLPFTMRVLDSQGHQVGGVDSSGKILKQVPFSDYLNFKSAAGESIGQMAFLVAPANGTYTVQLDPVAGASPTTPFSISLVVPRSDGSLRQIVVDNLSGSSPVQLPFGAGDPYQVSVNIGGAAGAPAALTSDEALPDAAPTVIAAVQRADADILPCTALPLGRIVALLFSEQVSPASVEDQFKTEDIVNYTPDGNRVLSVALQPDGRTVLLALRDPVGPFLQRQMTVSGITDLRGHVMAAQTVPIESTITAPGGVVTGRVLQADGTPVAFANVRLFTNDACPSPEGVQIIPVGITTKSADANGAYSFDYLAANQFGSSLLAIDPESEQSRTVPFQVQRDGQRLSVDVVLLGRGTFKGRTLDESGKPIGGTNLRLVSLTDQSQYGLVSAADGTFSIAGIPVGQLVVEAVNLTARAQTVLTEAIPFAGSTTTVDVVLFAEAQVTIAYGQVSGYVLRADGTPVSNVPVVAYYQNFSQPAAKCPGSDGPGPPPVECAVAVAQTDTHGGFEFDAVLAGTIRVNTFDQTSLQQGNVTLSLAANQAASANILLAGGLGTVQGTVFDASGNRVPGAQVGGGLSLATTDANGNFTLTDVPVGHANLVAVSQALATKGSVQLDIIKAGEVVNATIVLDAVGSVAGVVRLADGSTPAGGVKVYLFQPAGGGQVAVAGTAITDNAGRYTIAPLNLGDYTLSAFKGDLTDGNTVPVAVKFANQVVKADVTFRGGGGTVTGRALDSDGVTPLTARVSVSGDQLVTANGIGFGFQHVENFQIADTDLTGRFTLHGVWVGPFTLRAVGQFSPDPIALQNTMPAAGATVQMDVRLQPTSTIGGRVFLPDGVTPAGANLIVKYHSDAFKTVCTETGDETECTTIPQGIQEETTVTDADGKFGFALVNAGSYVITASDSASGKTAQIHASVKPGETADVSVRLVGLGQITVHVLGSDTTTAIPGAKVDVMQVDFPNKTFSTFADALGNVTIAGGDAFTEGAFVVMATDVRNGFAGRASGSILHDGDNVSVNVYLFNQSGSIVGTVFQPDGFTAVPNAEVVVSKSGRPLAFLVTDATGGYRVDQVPLGSVSVDIFEAATGRRGSATGSVDADKQLVPINVREAAQGLVRGTVLDASNLTPLPGWAVTLTETSSSGRVLGVLVTTAGVDGAFSFPGVPQGAFTLRTTMSGVNGSGTAAGSLDREAQVLDIPLLSTIVRPLVGTIVGRVFNPDGTQAPNGPIDVCGGTCASGGILRSLVSGVDGTFEIDQIPIGRYEVRARAQIGKNVGSAFAQLTNDGDTAGVTITMVGLSVVSGHVLHEDGSPAGNVQLQLDGKPATGCNGVCTAFSDAGGSFSFIDVPAQTFKITATDPLSGLKGVVGDTLSAGDTKVVTIVLTTTGGIAGRVLFQNGTPAGGITAQVFQSTNTGGHSLFVQSQADGTFAFDTTYLGPFTLDLQDPIGTGVAHRTGTISGAVNLGDIRLDETPPAVGSVTPAPSSSGVPLNQAVHIVFTEQVDASTVNLTNITLNDGSANVPGTVVLENGDTTATFTPLAPFKESTRYSLRVTGIKDLVGKQLKPDYVASFVSVDLTPPSFVEISPAANTSGVTIYAPVRLALSEPIDPTKTQGTAIAVTAPSGPVAGRIDYALGNTVVVFTPTIPLADETTYQVHVAKLTDLSGNTQAQPLDFSFATTDRTPPTIAGLSGPPTVVESGVAQVVADVGAAHDVAFVDFLLNGTPVATSRSAPFTLSFQATPTYGHVGDQIQVAAVATDTSGNRGPASAAIAVTVTADQPPSVTITAPVNGVSARNGDRVTVTVRATDDLGVTKEGFKAQTGKPQDTALDTLTSPSLDHTQSFAFVVPEDAAPGSTIQIEASAADTKGQVGQAVPVSITVTDSVPPTVTITGVSTGQAVRAGQSTNVVVSAQDLGGVSNVTFSASGVAVLNDSRTIDPAQNSALASFSVAIPANARPGDSVTLHATATDKAGNVGTAASVILPVADTVPPTVQLSTDAVSQTIVPGQTVNVFADAADTIAVASVSLTGTGAFSVSDARPVSPPSGSAHVAFSINVPGTAADGAVLNLQAVALDSSNNASSPAFLSLTVRTVAGVVLPSSTIVGAGESVSVPVQIPGGAPAGGQLVTFATADPRIATVDASVQFGPGDVSKTVTVTGQSGGSVKVSALVQNVERASTTVTVEGGVIDGDVLGPDLNPVAGAQVTVTGGGTFAAIADANGHYRVSGLIGPAVTVKAVDPSKTLRGAAGGTMNVAHGFAHVNVILLAAGAIDGTVRLTSGAPAPANVQVQIFDVNAPTVALATTFTDAAGAYEFPVVTVGSYILDAVDTSGNHGRSTAAVASSGQEVQADVTFLGRGSVTGVVLDASSRAVANAALTLTASSIFGSVTLTKNANLDGTFRFDGIFIGGFTLNATDPITAQAGMTTGLVSADGQTVDVTVHLASYGNVHGVVRRADGVTTVANATVTLAGTTLTATTDSTGQYSFNFLPLGFVAVSVKDSATRAVGQASTTLTINGATVPLDVQLQPQGIVVTTVRDANGGLISGALVTVAANAAGFSDTLTGTTDVTGTVVIEHVLAGGVVNVSAKSGNLTSESEQASLAANETKTITVTVEPTASITGQLFLPDGQTPATSGSVSVSGPSNASVKITDGSFRFDGLKLGTYTLNARDAQNHLRAFVDGIELTANGQVETRNLIEVGVGTVTGRVINPNGSSAPNVSVTLSDLAPDFGGGGSAITNAAGIYTISNLAIGHLVISAAIPAQSLRGEAVADITADGQTVTADILLQNNAVTLPKNLFDGNGNLFDLQANGMTRSGTDSVFVAPSNLIGAEAIDVTVNGLVTPFVGSPTSIGTTELAGRQIVVEQDNVGGVNLTRKMFVPSTGYFARYLEILDNPTGSPITLDLHLLSHTKTASIVTTSSGDGTLDVSDPANPDRWVVLDDASDVDPFVQVNLPPVAWIFDGQGGAARVGSAIFTQDPDTSSTSLSYQWNSVTVPPGGTVAYLHFVVQESNRAAAIAAATRLTDLPPEALDGLTADEESWIQNFLVPTETQTDLPPLPTFFGGTGTLNVLVQRQSGAAVPGATISVVTGSAQPFYSAGGTADATGHLVIQGVARGSLVVSGSIVGVTGAITGAAVTTLAAGESKNVTVTLLSYGSVSGTLKFTDGTPAVHAPINMLNGFNFLGSTQTDTTGAFSFAPMQAGQSFSLRAYNPTDPTYYRDTTGFVITSDGQQIAQNLVLPGFANVQVTVQTGDGVAIPGALVQLKDAFHTTFRTAIAANSSGVAVIPTVPEGAFSLFVTNPANGVVVQASGTVASSDVGQTVNVLVRMTIALPTNLFDRNGFLYDLQRDGSLLHGTSNAFGSTLSLGEYNLLLSVNGGAYATFAGSATGVVENNGREIDISQTMAGLNVTRKIFVPTDGFFARYLEFVNNPTAAPVTVGIQVRSQLTSARPETTSSGDANVGPNDMWSVMGINSLPFPARPTTGDVLEGPSAPLAITTESNPGSSKQYVWNTSIAPGQTVAIMHFVFQQFNQDMGVASAERLVQLPPEAIGGMTAAEIGEIANFVVPSDGSSSLEPLPATPGIVTGQLLTGDNVTGIPNTTVVLLSTFNPIVGSAFAVTSATGAYTLSNVGIAPFTLSALNTLTGTVPAGTPGDFPSGQTTVTQNLVFANTGAVRGTVRRGATAVGSGSITLTSTGSTSSFFASFNIATNGTYSFTGVPVGTYLLHANVSGVQGDAAVTITTTLSSVDVAIGAGTASGTITFVSGAPAQGASVQVVGPSFFSATVTTNAAGAYSIGNLPLGKSLTLNATYPGNTAAVSQSAPFVIPADGATVTVNGTLPAIAAALQVKVVQPDGVTPIGGALVGTRLANGQNVGAFTDANGIATIQNVPQGSYTVTVSDGNGVASTTVVVTAADDGKTVAVTFALPAAGTVEGSLFAADGNTLVGNGSVGIKLVVSILDTATGTVQQQQTVLNGSYLIGGITSGPQGFTVNVATPDGVTLASANGSFAVRGDFRNINFTLPIPVITGNVQFANGDAVPNPSVTATQLDVDGNQQTYFAVYTDGDGFYALVGPGVGDFVLTAQDPSSGLSKSVPETFSSTTDTLSQDITVQASATVQGIVFDAFGNTMPFAQVGIAGSQLQTTLVATADENGQYTITQVPLGTITVQACVFDFEGNPMPGGLCKSSTSVLNATGETVYLTLPFVSELFGNIFGPGFSQTANAQVTIENADNPGPLSSRFAAQLTSDQFGQYDVFPVPVGNITVTAQGPDGTFGAARSQLDASFGQIDVTLGNAASFPYTLDGFNGFRYDISCAGTIADGGTSDGTLTNAFDDFPFLTLGFDAGGGASFPCQSFAILDTGARQAILGDSPIGGALRVTRKVYVPDSGDFARYLEVFSNTSDTDVSLTATATGNTGSEANTLVYAAPADNGNLFAVTSDARFTGAPFTIPVLGFVFGGAGAAVNLAGSHFADFDGNVSYAWHVTVPAHQTRIVMHFVLQRYPFDGDSAYQTASDLANLSLDELNGMTQEERQEVVNFQIP